MAQPLVLILAVAIISSCVDASPLLLSHEDDALLERLAKLARIAEQGQDHVLLVPSVTHHRVRRQSDSGISDLFSNLGGRFSSFRESLRDTVRPIGEQLNPMPLVENVGKMLAEASTNTITRGRSAMQGVREFGSRSVGRLRDGATDAWDSLRDNWEEFWDL